LPAGNGPGTGTRVLVIRDAAEQPAKLDGGGQFAAVFVCGADSGGFFLGEDKHSRIMAGRAMDGKGNALRVQGNRVKEYVTNR